MRSRVQQWGNSLALRIPKPFAEETGLGPRTEVNISVEGNALVVVPIQAPHYTLEELLEGVTAENLHGEVDTGPPVGREVW